MRTYLSAFMLLVKQCLHVIFHKQAQVDFIVMLRMRYMLCIGTLTFSVFAYLLLFPFRSIFPSMCTWMNHFSHRKPASCDSYISPHNNPIPSGLEQFWKPGESFGILKDISRSGKLMEKNGQRVSGSEKRMDKIGKVCLDLEKGWTKWAKYVWIWTKWAKAVWILNKDGKGKK